MMSFREGEDARVAKPNVHNLPPTQPEVATEQHMKIATMSKRKRVPMIANEQVSTLYGGNLYNDNMNKGRLH